MTSVNLSISAAGAQPTPPATLLGELINNVIATNPGYTANLPGSLIEDISSTDVQAMAAIDQACVDLINSMSPFSANAYLLGMLGAQLGIQTGQLSNSSAYVLFTGLAGFTIQNGFIVGDGANQYTVQDGGVLAYAIATNFTATINNGSSLAGNLLTISAIPSGQIMIGDAITGPSVPANTTITGFISGTFGGAGVYTLSTSSLVASEAMTGATHGTAQLYVVANQYGNWAIPANSITTVITSVPTGYPLTVTNLVSGTTATAAETESLYRARINIAQLAPATGTQALVKSALQNIPGVQARSVSVAASGKIMVAGGDPYLIANALLQNLFDLSDFAGSTVLSNSWTGTGSIAGNVLTLTAVTGTVKLGDIVSGNYMISPTIITGFSGGSGGTGTYFVNYSQAVASEALTGSNSLRNQVVTLINAPDIYSILFVVPVQQQITMTVNWSTFAPNFTSNTAVNNLVNAALVNYINLILVSQPINVFEMQQIFLDNISSVISPAFISNLTFAVYINGVLTNPSAGTGLIYGDSEGYFVTTTPQITVARV